MPLGDPFEYERGAAMEERRLRRGFADGFRRRAARPRAIGIAPDFARVVRSLQGADDHHVARRALVHTNAQGGRRPALVALRAASSARDRTIATLDAILPLPRMGLAFRVHRWLWYG